MMRDMQDDPCLGLLTPNRHAIPSTMDEDDWFRSSAWDDDAKQIFRKKLARARNQKSHYLRSKASAIADDHPFDALALYDEYIDADDEHIPSGNYSKSMVYLKLGEIDKALELLDHAMGVSGLDMSSPAVLEFAFLVGLHRRPQHYNRALEVLQALDDLAQNSVGRPFERNFAGSAGAAFILYETDHTDDAKHAAAAALRLALSEKELIQQLPERDPLPIMSAQTDRIRKGLSLADDHPNLDQLASPKTTPNDSSWSGNGLGRVQQLPSEWITRLIIISDIWDESALGPIPAI